MIEARKNKIEEAKKKKQKQKIKTKAKVNMIRNCMPNKRNVRKVSQNKVFFLFIKFIRVKCLKPVFLKYFPIFQLVVCFTLLN